MPWLNRRWNGSVVGTSPQSYSTLCQNRAYNRCSTACSTPPMYRSTLCQYCTAAWLNGSVSLWGSM